MKKVNRTSDYSFLESVFTFYKDMVLKNIQLTQFIMKTTYTLVVALFAVCALQAQINKDILTQKPGTTKLNYPKMDPIIQKIVQAGEEGTYKITMAAITLTKRVDTHSKYVGSTSYTTVSSSKKFYPLRKADKHTVQAAIGVNNSVTAASIKIFTTSIGGQEMTIRYVDGAYDGLIEIKNLNIKKMGADRFFLTGESNINGDITHYIFNIFKNVTQ